MFSFKLISGDASAVLKEPYSVVLTKSAAKIIFGDENPLGQLVKTGNNELFKVTGIAEDPPENSQIQFSALLSFESLYKNPNNYMDWNGGNQYYTFIKTTG